MEIRPDHIAIYIRWSTEDQGEGTTLEVQLEGCKHYVLSQGWQINADLIFVDDGYSGGTLRRPAVTGLRRRVREGAVDCVVVFKLDRLSRSVLDTVNLVLDEWEGRCYIKSAREPIDTTSPAGKLFFYMLLSYAEWERSVIKERTFSGKLRRAQEGKVPGRYPYGYGPGDQAGCLAVAPAAAAVVRDLYIRYARGEGILPIVGRLNQQRTPSPGGGQWHRSTVVYILRNPLYKGEIAFCRTSRNHKRERDPSQPYYIKNPEWIRTTASAVVPLVEPALWERVQVRLAGRRRSAVPPRALESGHLLTGLLRCRCGFSLTGARPHGRHYYVCSAIRERGGNVCGSAWIPQAVLDQLVVSAVTAHYDGPEFRAGILHRMPAPGAGQCRSDLAAELGSLRRQLRSLAEQAARLNRAFRAGDLPATLYRENRAEIDAERCALLQRSAAQSTALARLAAPGGKERPRAEWPPAVDPWSSLARREQKEVLRHLLAGIQVWQPRGSCELHVELVWRRADADTAIPTFTAEAGARSLDLAGLARQHDEVRN